MAVCPQCSNSLVQDFGVVSCSQCQAVLFIDMDGNVHFSGENQEPAVQSLNEAEEPNQVEVEAPEGFADNWLSNDQPIQETQIQESVLPELEGEIVAVELAETPEVLDLSPTEPEPEKVKVALNDFSDVESFANSNSTVGPLTYTVTIEDINTKEVRAELKEALADKKFQWDASELIKKIKGGKLVLDDLGPVKASVVIHRIRELKVKISWRQNVYG